MKIVHEELVSSKQMVEEVEQTNEDTENLLRDVQAQLSKIIDSLERSQAKIASSGQLLREHQQVIRDKYTLIQNECRRLSKKLKLAPEGHRRACVTNFCWFSNATKAEPVSLIVATFCILLVW